MALILVVDDEPAVRRLVRTTLEMRGHEVRVAADGLQAQASVLEEHFELIVLDWMLPDMTGLDVCRAVRANPNTTHIPIIFLTAIDALDTKIAGLDAGADDYITKPFEPQELLARVSVQLRKAAERGQINPLTQLPGNALIDKAIRDRLVLPQAPFALFYFDLDDFKSYNDYFGFGWGDQLLKLLADVLRHAMFDLGGPHSFLGHVGGDDFVGIGKPEVISAVCEQAIGRFDAGAAELCESAGAGEGFFAEDRAGAKRRFGPPSLSIAVITNSQREFSSPLEVGQFAAQAKKAAKQIGGSGYVVSHPRAEDEVAMQPRGDMR